MTWYKKIIKYVRDQEMHIPIISRIYKGDESIKVSVTIKKTLNRQAQIIQTECRKEYQTMPDVWRAAISIGMPLLYEMKVNNKPDVQENMQQENEFEEKMQILDAFTKRMDVQHQCFVNGVFGGPDCDPVLNRSRYQEIKKAAINEIAEYGLKRLGEKNIRKIENGEKIVNLMECRTWGGGRK